MKEVEMRRQPKRPARRGQSLLEYALMIVVLLVVIIAMSTRGGGTTVIKE